MQQQIPFRFEITIKLVKTIAFSSTECTPYETKLKCTVLEESSERGLEQRRRLNAVTSTVFKSSGKTLCNGKKSAFEFYANLISRPRKD